MGCVSVKDLRSVNEHVHVRFQFGDTANVDFVKVGGGMSMFFGCGDITNVEFRATNKMAATFGLVCSVHTIPQLDVEPKNIWLMPENLFKDSVVITSNIVWHIEQ